MHLSLIDAVVGLLAALRLIGTLLPLVPGVTLVAGALLIWASETDTRAGWAVTAMALPLLVVGQIAKFLLPHRSLSRTGVSNHSQSLGCVLAVVGFFLAPVLGLPLGFVLGVFLSVYARRRDSSTSRRATLATVRALGIGVIFELATALTSVLVWAVTAVRVP